jgi:hypothetical protein
MARTGAGLVPPNFFGDFDNECEFRKLLVFGHQIAKHC